MDKPTEKYDVRPNADGLEYWVLYKIMQQFILYFHDLNGASSWYFKWIKWIEDTSFLDLQPKSEYKLKTMEI